MVVNSNARRWEWKMRRLLEDLFMGFFLHYFWLWGYAALLLAVFGVRAARFMMKRIV